MLVQESVNNLIVGLPMSGTSYRHATWRCCSEAIANPSRHTTAAAFRRYLKSCFVLEYFASPPSLLLQRAFSFCRDVTPQRILERTSPSSSSFVTIRAHSTPQRQNKMALRCQPIKSRLIELS